MGALCARSEGSLLRAVKPAVEELGHVWPHVKAFPRASRSRGIAGDRKQEIRHMAGGGGSENIFIHRLHPSGPCQFASLEVAEGTAKLLLPH
jgi:hypothetical protein